MRRKALTWENLHDAEVALRHTLPNGDKHLLVSLTPEQVATVRAAVDECLGRREAEAQPTLDAFR